MSERIITFTFNGKEYNSVLTDVHAWQLREFLTRNHIDCEVALWFSRDRSFDSQKMFEKIINYQK